MSYQLKQRQAARVRWRSGRAACRTGRPGLAFSVPAKVLMATPCTNSLGGESGGHKHEGCGGRRLCWKPRETLHDLLNKI